MNLRECKRYTKKHMLCYALYFLIVHMTAEVQLVLYNEHKVLNYVSYS